MVEARGGTGRGHLGRFREQGVSSIPFPQPDPPNGPLPQPQHLVHTTAVPAGQVPSNRHGL